ncbi:hypothetical protein THAOC_36334, partial [Thalassiosira oceanica]
MNASILHKRSGDVRAGNGHRQHHPHANGSPGSSAAHRRHAQRSVLAWLRAAVGIEGGRVGKAEDENFAKYGKRSAKVLRNRLIYCALCLSSFVFGASVVMLRHSPPADEPKLRNRKSKTDALRRNGDRPAGEGEEDRGSSRQHKVRDKNRGPRYDDPKART